MKNIIPSFTSGKWSLWYAFENKKPVATSSDDALTLMAKAYTDAGKWICTFDVTPGMDYIFSFDVKLERIEYHRACVRAIAVWQDEKGTMLRCDYAVNEEKLGENTIRLSKHITAPKKNGKYNFYLFSVFIDYFILQDNLIAYSKNPSKRLSLVCSCAFSPSFFSPLSRALSPPNSANGSSGFFGSFA